VRRRWNQLVGKRDLAWEAAYLDFGDRPGGLIRPVEASWAEPVLLVGGVTTELEVLLDYALPVPLEGELRLVLPEGWQGVFLTDEGSRDRVPVPEDRVPADWDTAPEDRVPADWDTAPADRVPADWDTAPAGRRVRVAVTPPCGGEPGVGDVALRYRGEFEILWELPLLVGTDGQVTVERRRLEDRPVIHVDNGVLRFDVVADAGGQLIRLEDVGPDAGGQGYSFLEDIFPDCRAKVFVTHFVGGTQPLVFHASAEQIFAPPAVLSSAEVVTEGAWEGVRVGWTEQYSEELRGQQFALTYLVAPGVPVVRLRVSRTSPTDRRFEWLGGFMLVLDQQAAATLGAPRFTVPGSATLWTASHPWRRFSALRGFAGPMYPQHPWAWAEIGQEGEAVRRLGFLGLGAGTATPVAFDFGEFRGAFLMGVEESGNGGGVQSLEYALVVNRPDDEARAWLGALSALG
jgi:hypothetical protein